METIESLKEEFFNLLKNEKIGATPEITSKLDELALKIKAMQPPIKEEKKKKSKKSKNPAQIVKVE